MKNHMIWLILTLEYMYGDIQSDSGVFTYS